MTTFTQRAWATAAKTTASRARKPTQAAAAKKAAKTTQPSPDGAWLMRLATWNVDGLCEAHLQRRSQESARILLAARADVVFLQEVVAESQPVFQRVLGPAYALVDPARPGGGGVGGGGYYTLAFVRRDHRVVRAHRDAFAGAGRSQMGRDMLVLDVAIRTRGGGGGGGGFGGAGGRAGRDGRAGSSGGGK